MLFSLPHLLERWHILMSFSFPVILASKRKTCSSSLSVTLNRTRKKHFYRAIPPTLGHVILSFGGYPLLFLICCSKVISKMWQVSSFSMPKSSVHTILNVQSLPCDPWSVYQVCTLRAMQPAWAPLISHASLPMRNSSWWTWKRKQ